MSEANGLWVMLSLTHERHNLGLGRKLWNTLSKKKKKMGILKNSRGITRHSKLSGKIDGSSLWKYNSKQSCSTWYDKPIWKVIKIGYFSVYTTCSFRLFL